MAAKTLSTVTSTASVSTAVASAALHLALIGQRYLMRLRPAWTRSMGVTIASRATSFSSQRRTLHGVELMEHGTHAMLSVFDIGRFVEECDARLLQSLGGLDGVDGMVEWCVQVHNGDIQGVLRWERSSFLLWKKAFERRARRAWCVAAFLAQGQHLDHGTKVVAFTAARACVIERVRHVGYLLWEWLGDGDVEVVTTDVEEGPAVAEAILEAGEVVVDTVDGAKHQDKA
jgi:hypothetical protein